MNHSARSLLVSAAPAGLLFFSLLLLSNSCSAHSCHNFLSSVFFLTLSGTSGRNYPVSFSPFFFGYNGSPVTQFLWKMTRQMNCPDELRSFSHLQSNVVFSFLSYPLISYFEMGRTASSKSFNTYADNLGIYGRTCASLFTLAVFSLVFVATDTAFC